MPVLKRILNVNGAERIFICDPESDTLADVVRKMGLTGTKVGCEIGQCGACNVILNGKLVRSCTRRIRNIEDYSTVYTIEAMGTAENLHPLQAAWIKYGGVQCGFCTPGFIVSAKALLDENPSPGREDVRAWFKKHHNLCRCTGYKPLVDSVMAAAEVMRGEKTMADLEHHEEEGKVFNTWAPKPTALGKVLGIADFGDDIAVKTPEMLHAAPVMPPISHGLIKNIDTSDAEKAPGVIKVVTHRDVPGDTKRFVFPTGTAWAFDSVYERPVMCDKKIFRLGDIVAVVVADTRRHARDAARLVKVEYEELPAYMDVLDSIKPDATRIQENLPNMFLEKPLFFGEDTREIFKKAKHSVSFSFGAPRQSHLPIEPDTCTSYIDEDGVVTIVYKSQCVYDQRAYMAKALEMLPQDLRVVMIPSGGSFGYSMCPGMPTLMAVVTMAVGGRPVNMRLSYAEHQLNSGKRSATYTNASLCCDEKGMLLGGELHALYDQGCYPQNPNGIAMLPLKFFLYPYNVKGARVLSQVAFTNTPNSIAYRCPNIPAVYANTEQMIDMLAEKVGMDPLDFRYQNSWQEGDIATYGEKPTVYVIRGVIDRTRPIYERVKAHALANSTADKKLGVGVALGSFLISANGDHAEVALELNADGTFTQYNTWEDMGQGSDIGSLALTHEALKPLGVEPGQIRLVMNDTQFCPDTGRAAGSRSNYVNSHAIRIAADKLMDAMRKPDGSYRTYAEMTAEGIPTKYFGLFNTPINENNDENTGLGFVAPDQSHACFVAEVETDVNTGVTRVIEMHCVADIGIITNYLSVEGQAYSGLMHSLGYALSEDFSDMKKHLSLVGAGFPSIDQVPDGEHFTIPTDLQTHRPYSPFGGSGISEAYQSSGHVAILNAIYNAVGVRVDSQPARPEKIKAAIDAKAAGSYKLPEPYDFGCDFNERLDYMKAHPAAAYEGEEIKDM